MTSTSDRLIWRYGGGVVKRFPSSSTEFPVLSRVFTSSPVITSSAVGLGPTLSLCTELPWVKNNLFPFMLVSMLRSAYFYCMLQSCFLLPRIFLDRWCATWTLNLFYFRTLMFSLLCFCMLRLSANLINMGLGNFLRESKLPILRSFSISILFTIFSYIPMSCINTFSKSMVLGGRGSGAFFYTPLILKLFSIDRDCNSWFGYLHQILTEQRSLLILLSVIIYQVSVLVRIFFSVSFSFFWSHYFVISSICSPWLSNRSIKLAKLFSMLAMLFIMSLIWK